MNKALSYIVGLVFLLSVMAFAADKPGSAIKSEPLKTNVVKTAKMHATGKVIEIYNELIKIERTVKGDVESMEFALDKPAVDIGVNDSVKIEYMEKDGKLVASRVTKVILKKKEVKPVETKPVPGKK
jgi:hypothetical protein